MRIRLICVIILYLVFQNNCSGQLADSWVQKHNFITSGWSPTMSLTIDSIAYVGLSIDTNNNTLQNDFWAYNPISDSWTQMAAFPGVARQSAVSFSIGNKGYFGTGNQTNDFWEYDPSTNVWTRKANFGGISRAGAVGFSIGNKGYIGTGDDDTVVCCYTTDFWEYDPSTDSWTQIANAPGFPRFGCFGMAAGGYGYVGGGQTPANGIISDFYRYDPLSNSWTQVASLPIPNAWTTGFSIGSTIYMGTGFNYAGDSASNDFINEFWEYDGVANCWTQKSDYGGGVRREAIGFSVGNRGYLGFGAYNPAGSGGVFDDFWEYSPSPTTQYPYIILSTGSLNRGQSISINGNNFSSGDKASLIFTGPNSFQDTVTVNNTVFGTFAYTYLTDTSMSSGQYLVNAIDSFTGIYAPVKSFVLNATQTSNTHLTILAPVANDTLFVNDSSQISWQDKMVLGQNYPINGAHRGYYYKVEYSSDNGSTWQSYTVLQGSAYINSINTFHVPVAFGVVGNGYYVRVIDYYNSSNRDSSGAFVVINHVSSSANIKVQLYWDFSYNNQNNGLYGVAADGDARLFLVVSKIDSSIGATISNVSVQLNDNWNNSTAALGKVMAATQISNYGEEANAANSLTATQNTEAFSRYWFWYVAPDDFVGNNPNDLVAGYRNVNAHFAISYSDGSSDSLSHTIQIVRPPLCFVHGLASDPSTWLTFSSTGTGSQLDFLNDPRFYTSNAIQIDASQSFDVNAQFLTLGFSNTNSLIFQNSLQGVIKNLRDQGYAANRCDYIGHSMGGSILRYALDNYSDYFNRTGVAANSDYKNYKRGYVNKVITISTPHNGSPWADILNRYVGDLSYLQRMAIELVYDIYPNSLPFSFITQNQFGLGGVPTFKVVDAVTDLQIDSTQGGVKFTAESINAHLISAGIFPGVNYNSSNYMVPQQVINIVDGAAEHVDFLNDFADATIANEQDQQVVSDLIQIGNNSTNPVQTALQYLERMADFYNIAVFIPSSDLVVSKSSALADNPVTAPNVSVFDNYIGHAFIRPILNDIDAGNEVNTLLNSPISSNNFAPIAASSYLMPRNLGGNQRSTNTVLSIRDNSFLKIVNPTNGANLFTDSIVDIKLSLADTAHLISLKVRFQNKTYKLNPVPGISDLNTQINSNILDSSVILVQAFYKNGDSSIFYYDSIGVNIKTNSTLVGFTAQQQIVYLNINQEKFPDYVSYYLGFATSAGNFSKYIAATVANTSIVTFDPIHKGFIGVSTGETYAVISYKGLKDTIYLVVGENPIDSLTTGIKPIPSIATSDGPKLFCYPNPFSDLLSVNFEVAVSGAASLKIYDLLGRAVISLFQGQKEQGQYQTTFDGSLLPEGMYLCELRNENMRTIKKIVVAHSK